MLQTWENVKEISYYLLRRGGGKWFIDGASWQLDQCFCDICTAKLADPYLHTAFQSVTPGSHPVETDLGKP